MGLFSRGASKPAPAVRLRRETCTPNGTVWSVEATPGEESELAEGDLTDEAMDLQIGDLIYVRAAQDRSKRFTLRVTGRQERLVHCERVRH